MRKKFHRNGFFFGHQQNNLSVILYVQSNEKNNKKKFLITHSRNVQGFESVQRIQTLIEL